MPIDPVQLTYDGYNLQDSTIITSDIDGDEAAPPKALGVYELPVLHGAKKTFEKVCSRRITIQGTVKSPTISGLVGKLEELKEVATRQDKVLAITYPGNYPRIYTCSVEGNPEVTFEPWSLNLARFKMTFVAVEPWSVQSVTSISGVYNVTGPVQAMTVGISGTLDPQPQIYFNTTASGSRFSLTNLTTGDTIDVTSTFSGIGRSLLIDCYNSQVSIDGSPAIFKGIFPRFVPGNNSLIVQTYGTAGAAVDQAFEDTSLASTYSIFFGGNNYLSQSFKPTITKLLAVEIYVRSYNVLPAGDITVEIQADSAGKPSGTALATGTIAAFSSTTSAWKRATLSSYLTVTPETTYWIVLKATTSSSYRYFCPVSYPVSQYSNGSAATSTNAGTTWTTRVDDILFRVYSDQGTPLSGKMVIAYNPRRW